MTITATIHQAPKVRVEYFAKGTLWINKQPGADQFVVMCTQQSQDDRFFHGVVVAGGGLGDTASMWNKILFEPFLGKIVLESK